MQSFIKIIDKNTYSIISCQVGPNYWEAELEPTTGFGFGYGKTKDEAIDMLIDDLKSMNMEVYEMFSQDDGATFINEVAR